MVGISYDARAAVGAALGRATRKHESTRGMWFNTRDALDGPADQAQHEAYEPVRLHHHHDRDHLSSHADATCLVQTQFSKQFTRAARDYGRTMGPVVVSRTMEATNATALTCGQPEHESRLLLSSLRILYRTHR